MKKKAEGSVLFFHVIFCSTGSEKEDVKGGKECTVEKSLDLILGFGWFVDDSLMLYGFHFIGILS